MSVVLPVDARLMLKFLVTSALSDSKLTVMLLPSKALYSASSAVLRLKDSPMASALPSLL